MHRIPMIFYTSESWGENNYEKKEALKNNAQKIVTNDLLFNVALDLWGIETTGVERNEKLSIASDKYTLENPTTLHGKVALP